MNTYRVHVTLGDRFEDLYIEARSPEAAIAKAKKITTLKHRFTNFML